MKTRSKVADAEQFLTVLFGFVDEVHHGVVGGNDDAGGGRLRFAGQV